ncbi:MAG: MBL fold metallo-hydrolase [Ktedonobacteraceae bacterium]
MRVTSLASGSSGNALLVEAGPGRRTRLLVDAGLSGSVLVERLRQAGTCPAQLQGVLVTHEHSDHIIGLPVLMKRYAIPVITAPDTYVAIEQNLAQIIAGEQFPANGVQGESIFLQDMLAMPLQPGSRSQVGDIEVISFPVSHDALAPCGYLLSAGGCRVCIAIDSGEVTPIMLEAMHHADLLVLESNHDRERLLRGPYPYHLKLRILSPTGHLSNDQAADAILQTWRTDSVRWLWLSHLSRTNNTPKLALKSMLARLEAAKANLSQIHVSVLPPGMGSVWDSTQLWESPSLWEMPL